VGLTKACRCAPRGQTTFSNLITIELKISHFFDITRHQKISHIVAYQTLYVKPCYNGFMGRNYFSKYGGPCFINDGVSQHDHNHKPGHTHEDIKPSNLIYGLLAALCILLPVCIAIAALAII
jgi:hypothetical protein